MGIVTNEMIEESKTIDLKVIEKNIYESARACIETHRLVTGIKPKTSAMDMVRLAAYVEDQDNNTER